MNLDKSKILITGATGFVGKNLIEYLSKYNPHQLECVDLRKDFSTHKFQNVNAFIHLAGKAHDLKKVSQPEEYYQVNYELTKELYDQFLMSDAGVFVFISSVKAAADEVKEILTEDMLPAPATPYGKSKLMAEQYIQSKPLPIEKRYYILRPCMIHGPGNKGNLNLLYKVIKKGIPYPLASFKNKRSFLSVENLCFVINELINTNVPSGVYQVADDETFSTNELINLIGKATGKKSRLWHIPQVLIKAFAKMGDFAGLPLNTERLHKLTENYVVDNSKIKAALNKPFPVSAAQGIEVTIKSFPG